VLGRELGPMTASKSALDRLSRALGEPFTRWPVAPREALQATYGKDSPKAKARYKKYRTLLRDGAKGCSLQLMMPSHASPPHAYRIQAP